MTYGNYVGGVQRLHELGTHCRSWPGQEIAKRAAAVVARIVAAASSIPFWINARTDVFLAGTGRIDDALERSAAYGVAARAAAELLTSGTYDAVADGIDYGALNAAVTPRLPC